MERITKIESAKRHLDSAIKLHFKSFDPIVVHTVGSTAFRVLRDLSENEGNISKHIYDNLPNNTKKEIFKIFNQDFNFFKHADNDPDKILEDFNPLINDNLLGLCCLHYEDLENEPTIYMNVFVRWFLLIDKNSPVTDSIQREKEKHKLYDRSRSEQLRIGTELIQNAEKYGSN